MRHEPPIVSLYGPSINLRLLQTPTFFFLIVGLPVYEACLHAFDNSTSQPSDHFSGLDYSPGFVYSSPSEHEYLRNSYTLPDPMVCTEHNLPPCCSENTISRFTSHCLVICGVQIPQPVTESYCFSSASMPSFYLQPTEFYSHVSFT